MSRAVLAHQLYQTTRCAFLTHEKNSVLGMLWHLLNPLAMSLVLYVVFSNVGALGRIPDYPLYILTGIIQFNFFANATTRAANGLLNSRSFVLNSTIPIEIVVLRSVLVEAVTYGIEVILIMVLVAFLSDGGLTVQALYFIPAMLGMFALTLGVSLALSALVVFVTDLTYVWSVVTRMLFFLTPIFYSVDIVSNPLARSAIGLNPLTQLTMFGREALLHGQAPVAVSYSVFVLPLVTLGLAWFIFSACRRAIPDYL